MLDYSRVPLPDINNKLYQPFWNGTSKGELRFPRCLGCQRFFWYPQLRCPHCQSPDFEWVAASGRGKLFTWTVVRYAFLPAYETGLPYIVGLVELESAPEIRLVTNIIESTPEEIEIGMPLQVVFKQVSDTVTLPLFKPVHR